MARPLLLGFLLFPLLLQAQGSAMPVFIGRSAGLLAPAVDGTGRTTVFGSSVKPDGTVAAVTDVYSVATDGSALRQLTRLAATSQYPPQGANSVTLAANAARAAYTVLVADSAGQTEQVRALDTASGSERTVAVDKEGCIQPLRADAALCPNCFFYCVSTPHLTSDGGKVLYSARRQQPFYTVNSDGSGPARLPVYSGALAPAPQRVISGNGLAVFTSAAPFGPTFAASATEVYAMNLDGSNIRAVTKFGSDASLYAMNATISADGTMIALESNRDPDTGRAGDKTHIYVVRSDGSGLRPLTFNVACLALNCPQPGGRSPSISGNGSLVAFLNGGRVFLARSDGSDTRPLAIFTSSEAQDPVISDDGSRVVFTVGPPNGSGGAIYSVKTDGTGLQAVYAPRSLNPNGVVAAVAGAQPSPGSLISAYGLNLAPEGLLAASGFPLPTTLGGVSLLVNGTPAPLLAVTPWQVNAQLPPETMEGPAAFQLRFADGTLGPAIAANVQTYSPAIFVLPSGITSVAAAFHGNTNVPADSAHPAKAGETLAIYGMGLGPVTPFVAAGQPAPSSPPAQTLAQPEVLIGNARAQVAFSGLTPGLAGVYQVNAVVPSGLKPGQYVIVWRIGGVSSSSFAGITVQ
jgi:uncharacterized protein (TIGR03437 family)